MAVSKRLRYEVLRRDNHTCRYCGQAAPDVSLTIDHVLPTTLGGRDEAANLVAACTDCNAGKAASHPDSQVLDDVSSDALRWAAAMERASELRRSTLSAEQRCVDWFDSLWLTWSYGDNQPIPRDHDWERSVLRFFNEGLELDFVEHAVRSAMGNTRLYVKHIWRYFCGICWRELDDRRDIAAALIKADEAGGRFENGP